MLFTLLLTTAILMIRPAEVFPAIAAAGIPLYEIAILASLATSYQTILAQFERGALAKTPLTVMIMTYFAWLTFCHLPNGQFPEFLETGEAFLKVLLYYFLVVGVLSTAKRLMFFLRAIVVLGSVATLIAFLNFWRIIRIEGQENVISDGLERMGGTGIFKDPNDMASILSLLSILALFFATKRRTPILLRAIWIGFVVFFFQAILATSSRGGLAALGGGLFGWALARFGKKGLILVPIMMGAIGLIGGRQGDLSLSSGTGQSRIQIQHVGLTVYVSRPLFGVGTGHYVIDIAHHVAHNSFLQAFAETGFIGGAIFCAAYGFSVLTLIQLGRPGTIEYIDPDLSEFRPCVVGLLSCECVAKMSLTHNWLLTTYLFWAITTVYLKLCGEQLGRDRWTQKPLLVWYLGFGFLGTMFFYFYLNAMVRFG